MADELPEKIRAFVAIYPSATVLEKIVEAQKKLRDEFSSQEIRWTKPEQIHLTTQFLGWIETSRLDEFQRASEIGCSGSVPFQLRASGLGCFPTPRQPRIIWAGLSSDSENLQWLKTNLDEALKPVGYVPEERDFHPHLTLGRVKELNGRQRRRVGEVIGSLAQISFGEWTVGQVQWMRSVLAPSGSTYELIQSFALAK